MTIPDNPRKAVVSVTEMAKMLDLSRSRFYALIQAGIFPKPARHVSCKRPFFDADLQKKCLEIRKTGVGLVEKIVIFNQKHGRSAPPTSRSKQHPLGEENGELVEALKSLGLTVTGGDVHAAVCELYPNGTAGIDQGEVIRKVFLHLRGRN